MLGLGLLLDKPTSAYHLTRSVLEHTDHLVGNHQLMTSEGSMVKFGCLCFKCEETGS